jgi:hypothetical protein
VYRTLKGEIAYVDQGAAAYDGGGFAADEPRKGRNWYG